MGKEKKVYIRLIDIIRKGYNNQTRNELLMVRYFSVKTAIKELSRCIEDTKRNGKTIRKQRRETMIKVLEVFYTYLYKSESGQVNPSMRTLAFLINPNLQYPIPSDDPFQAKAKERLIHATEMSVQRAIQTLQEIGMITVHKYYIDEAHFMSKKNPCFFYELTPLSNYSRLYLDTRADKYGKKFESKANVVVPGRSTSTQIIIPKTYDLSEERRKKKELRIMHMKLIQSYQEASMYDDKLIAICHSPTAKPIGTLTQILERRKKMASSG